MKSFSLARSSWLALVSALVSLALPATAATIVSGRLRDATSGGPVEGAAVSILHADRAIGTDRSNRDGDFQLSFDVRDQAQPQHLTLIVTHDQYVEASTDVMVVSGAAAKDAYPLTLIPKLIAGCRAPKRHAVVVGFFRRPDSGPPLSSLAARIRDVLEYALLSEIQKGDAIREDLPIMMSCDTADPSSEAFYSNFARALEADAFLGGYVRNERAGVVIEMRVADRFGVLMPPAHASTQPVDLDDPAAARFGAAAHEPILVALAVGYEKAGKHAHCVEITTAGESILGGASQELREIRQRCQQHIPNRGLLPGA